MSSDASALTTSVSSTEAETSRESWLRWRPTSKMMLSRAEAAILKFLKTKYSNYFIRVSGSNEIRTIVLNEKSTKCPLVMVHGMGAGVAHWIQNLDSLAAQRKVYAFDLLGFARSSHPVFSSDSKIAEAEFVHSIEEWRKAVNLNKFVLLGHSLGGYLSLSYALRFPEHVEHLIVCDPWGMPERPENFESRLVIPLWARAIGRVLSHFNPLASLRMAGPFGPGLVKRFRSDLGVKFGDKQDLIFDYIYHCNAQSPSGEAAFKCMMHKFGWARNPMLNRVADIDPKIGITVINGSRSWIDSSSGVQLQSRRPNCFVDVKIITGAGHHVYADRPQYFNEIVNKICDNVDKGLIPTTCVCSLEQNVHISPRLHGQRIANAHVKSVTNDEEEKEHNPYAPGMDDDFVDNDSDVTGSVK